MNETLNMQFSIKRLWCKLFHRSVMYIGGAQYQCWVCHEKYTVPWHIEPIHGRKV